VNKGENDSHNVSGEVAEETPYVWGANFLGFEGTQEQLGLITGSHFFDH